jgi:hypothetical protein
MKVLQGTLIAIFLLHFTSGKQTFRLTPLQIKKPLKKLSGFSLFN